MAKSCFDVLLLLIAIVSCSCSLHVAASRFHTHPHIRCSVCMAVTEHLGNKMNESAKVKTSVQNSHRLSKTNKVRRIDYETSELRAVELLEGICNEVGDKYQLQEDADGVRRFSANKELAKPKWYGSKDKEQLDNQKAKLKDTCFEFVDEYDELLTGLIRVERQLETMQTKVCVDAIKVCHTKAYYVSLKRERELRKKWEQRAEERRKREEEEDEKRRVEKEKAAGFDWRHGKGASDQSPDAQDGTNGPKGPSESQAHENVNVAQATSEEAGKEPPRDEM